MAININITQLPENSPKSNSKKNPETISLHTIDGSEIPFPTTFCMVLKTPVNKWDIHYQSQLVT